jgi:DNA-directed RNA polymerase beta subunit
MTSDDISHNEFYPVKDFSLNEDIKNDDLTSRDMISFLMSMIREKGLVGHNISVYNDLIDSGINKIMTQLFDISKMVRNERTQTEIDKKIKSYQIRIQFRDVKVGSPKCTVYLTGQFTDLYPSNARITGLPYSGAVTLSATITIRANMDDGSFVEKVAELLTFQIGRFPIMVRSSKCHTNNTTREGLKQMGEDPDDVGGYFIIKRGEYVVDLLENIRYNSPHIHMKMKPNEYVRTEFLSQPGGAFENSSQVRIRYMLNGQITIEINSTKFEKIRIPFFIIYRIFGMMSDRDITETIVFDLSNKGTVTLKMMEILVRAFHNIDSNFASIVNEPSREKNIQFVAERIQKYKSTAASYTNNDDVTQYINDDLLRSLDKVLLPHIGQTINSRINKLRFMGLLIRKTLLVHLGSLPPSDRDSYRNKRVHGSGISLAKAFKTQVNNNVISVILSSLQRMLKNNNWDSISDKVIIDSVKSALSISDLDAALDRSITASNKTITIRRKSTVNRVSSQILERKNIINTLCAIRNVVTQNAGNASKATDRADQMRRVNATYPGFICISQSNESGESVGMKKQLAISATVCTAGETVPLKMKLLSDPTIFPFNSYTSSEASRQDLSIVYVNGEPIGFCKKAYELVGRYRKLRREGKIDSMTTIYWDPMTGEAEFWVDVGRLVRPLLIVDNNIEEYDKALKSGNKIPFIQNIRFTKEHANLILSGKLTISQLIKDGIAEYITPEEQENCWIAESIDKLRKYKNDVLMQFSHCDVPQAIMGIAAHSSPLGNTTQAARVTYQTNHVRQACAVHAWNYPHRTDKNRFFTFYLQNPLVMTITQLLAPPSGSNIMIAYMSYGGDNQEDSAIINRASIDRGLFLGVFFRYEMVKLDEHEKFCNPDELTTGGLKPNASYDKLEDGFVRKGSIVRYGDVLVGKVVKIMKDRNKQNDNIKFMDKSVVYRLHEPALVENILKVRGDNDEILGIVKLRYERPLRTGDKLSSREGNKCLTDDHDVLTQRGWVKISKVTTNDKVACLLNGIITYQYPNKTMKYDVDEELYHVRNNDIDLMTTKNHRMWVRDNNSNSFQFATASDIYHIPIKYKKNGMNDKADIPLMVVDGKQIDMICWITFVMVIIRFRLMIFISYEKLVISIRSFNEKQVNSLCDLLNKMSIKYDFDSNKCVIFDKIISEDAKSILNSNKLPSYTWQLSSKQSREIINKFMEICDASLDNKINTIHKSEADDLQRLAFHAEWSANITYNQSCDYASIQIIKDDLNEPTVNEFSVDDDYVKYTGKVYCLNIIGGIFYVRRNGKPVWTGNSIIALTLPQSDMPILQNGMTPDLIINSHSFPTRMTTGQLIESFMAKINAFYGRVTDGTAFTPVDNHFISEQLVNLGFRYNGKERIYNGMTGEYLDCAIFTSPLYEQRLQKFVLDDEQFVDGIGPTDPMTGQPLGGGKIGGGLKQGEMENWGMFSQGAVQNLYEKISTDSDGRVMHICRRCGSFATYNEYHNIYDCKGCGQMADIYAIDGSKTAVLFHEELAACGIKVGFGLRPFMFESRS